MTRRGFPDAGDTTPRYSGEQATPVKGLPPPGIDGEVL